MRYYEQQGTLLLSVVGGIKTSIVMAIILMQPSRDAYNPELLPIVFNCDNPSKLVVISIPGPQKQVKQWPKP